MYRLSLLIITILIITVATNGAPAPAQQVMTTTQTSLYDNSLPYAAVTDVSNDTPQKGQWVLVGPYPKPVSGAGYIKRPYNNPNLIQENEEQRSMDQYNDAESARMAAQRKQDQLARMCQFSFAARRHRNGYMQGGPAVITPYKVYARQVVSQEDYRNACTQYYKDNTLLSND